MDMNNQEYNHYVSSRADPSPLWRDLLWAFCVGGGICAGGQGLMALYQSLGADKEAAGTWVSVTLIFLASLLTGLGVFDNIAKHAGAGTLVPITGFSNAMVSPALEFKSEGPGHRHRGKAVHRGRAGAGLWDLGQRGVRRGLVAVPDGKIEEIKAGALGGISERSSSQLSMCGQRP